jgi:carbamoyl-phosphate synthase large subunit
MQNKRIFVTGGAGVIGTALVEKLLEADAQILVGDLKPCPKKWLGKLEYRQGDLNALTAEEVDGFDPEIIFHLAATFERSDESYSFFGENYYHNVNLTHHLLDCVKDSQSLTKFILASSYLIYDPRLYQSETPSEIVCLLNEESPVYPRNICGAAKFFNEQELHFLTHFKEDVSFIAARIFRVYGRGSRDIISRWIRQALRNESLNVYRPEGKFDYIFADDVAEGLIRLSKAHESGIVNLGTGHARSVQEVLDILSYHFKDLKTETLPSAILYENSEASIHKLEVMTGWYPPHDLETGIEKLIAFERNELENPTPHPEQSNVLITSISKKIPLINAVRQAAIKSALFEFVFGCDSNPFCIGQYDVDEFWNSPPFENLPIEDFVSYCQSKKVKAIIPTRDGELEYFAKHRQQLLVEGIHPLVSSLETVKTCLDKSLFATALAKQRFPVIQTELSLDNLKAERYVVKERHGAGSHLIGLNLSNDEALAHSKNLKDPIFQPYITGAEWSVDLYRTMDGDVKGVIARQRNLVVGGESQVTTTASYPALEELCAKMADHLNLYGHAIFQVIVDAMGQFHVIECNPRFGGASTASLAAGLNSFLWFFMESAGIGLEGFPFMRSKNEIKQIRFMTDRIIVEEDR